MHALGRNMLTFLAPRHKLLERRFDLVVDIAERRGDVLCQLISYERDMPWVFEHASAEDMSGSRKLKWRQDSHVLARGCTYIAGRMVE